MKAGPRFLILPALLFATFAVLCAEADDKPNRRPGVDAQALFRDTIRPILTGKCLTCHGEKKKGGLDLTRRATLLSGGDSGPALTPGKPEESLLLDKVAAGEMPPKNPLTPEQVFAFKSWIEAGAPYADEPLRPSRAGADWWSLQPIQGPPPTGVRNPEWIRTPIDAFILAKLEEQGLAPAPEADRRTLIRRLAFDLIGLPPTPEEVEAFLADGSPDAFEKLVDRLLASPHYGERWGRHWLDVVRFGESHGYETNQLRPNAWPYRDYVIRAFNNDTPFPQFALEQLAGDTIPEADWLTQSATGFLVGGVHDVVGNQTIEGMRQQRMDDLDDIITATGTAFLGLTTNCARCHDHKFDPISQKDYYAFQAVFAGVEHAEREIPAPDAERRRHESVPLEAELARLERQADDLEPLATARGPRLRASLNARRNVERFAPVEARFVRFMVLATNNLEPCLDELEVFAADKQANVALASAGAKATASSSFPNAPIHKLEHVNDGRYGNGRSWISNEPGKGWVQIELPRVQKIDRIVWGRDREEKFKDRLTIDYRIEVAVEPGQWRVLAGAEDRAPFRSEPGPAPGLAELLSWEARVARTVLTERTRALRERLGSLSPMLKVYAGTFKQPEPAHLLTRGDPMRKGEVVAAGALAAVRPPLAIAAEASERDRRRALAQWIGHPENPLPARVMVNRLWQHHFGQGLVATPSDFGFQGDKPSHPQLLEWLATEYLRNGGRLKPLHRLILLSSTYRQSSRAEAVRGVNPLEIDKQNRFLWRMTPRRLEAEAIRDAVLSVSGKLDPRPGGPGYNLWEKNTNYVVVFTPKVELGPDEFRRMVYQFKPRTQQDPAFGAFDCPDAALVAPRRNVSTTALQALNLLNSGFVVRQSEFFAQRLRREVGENAVRQAERGFLLAFGRPPREPELAAAAALIRAHGTPAFCRALYNANEFVHVD